VGKKKKDKNEEAPKGYREVFARYVRRKDGTIMYPKNAKVFHFYVKD